MNKKARIITELVEKADKNRHFGMLKKLNDKKENVEARRIFLIRVLQQTIEGMENSGMERKM